jgi:hypothetical protein
VTFIETGGPRIGAAELTAAQRPEDVFGTLEGTRADQLDAARRIYREIARAVAPRRTGDDEEPFKRLGELYTQAQKAIAAGTYGKRLLTITTRAGRKYVLAEQVATGVTVNVHRCTPPGRTVAWARVVRHPRDNDLADVEARALRWLHGVTEGTSARYRAFVPELLDSFTYRQSDGVARRVTIVDALDGWHSLEAVHRRYPAGLDPRDMAWMWRRLLTVLGFAHQHGITHGAVLWPHVYIEPEQHGLILSEWSFSASSGRTIPLMHPLYRGWYPTEVAAKETPGPATDIAMGARCMLELLGDNPPTQYGAFFRGCMLANPRRRPQDAWELLREFDDLIERLHGPRRFRPFSMA